MKNMYMYICIEGSKHARTFPFPSPVVICLSTRLSIHEDPSGCSSSCTELVPLISRERINNKTVVSSPANVAGLKGLFEVHL